MCGERGREEVYTSPLCCSFGAVLPYRRARILARNLPVNFPDKAATSTGMHWYAALSVCTVSKSVIQLPSPISFLWRGTCRTVVEVCIQLARTNARTHARMHVRKQARSSTRPPDVNQRVQGFLIENSENCSPTLEDCAANCFSSPTLLLCPPV